MSRHDRGHQSMKPSLGVVPGVGTGEIPPTCFPTPPRSPVLLVRPWPQGAACDFAHGRTAQADQTQRFCTPPTELVATKTAERRGRTRACAMLRFPMTWRVGSLFLHDTGEISGRWLCEQLSWFRIAKHFVQTLGTLCRTSPSWLRAIRARRNTMIGVAGILALLHFQTLGNDNIAQHPVHVFGCA